MNSQCLSTSSATFTVKVAQNLEAAGYAVVVMHARNDLLATYSYCNKVLSDYGIIVRNDDVRRLTKQPKLTAIIQSRRLTLFGHIMRMDDNADAKRILLASAPADWRRQLGRPRITWLSTIQQDLKQHHLTLPKTADLPRNLPLWRMMSTYGATQSWVACHKRRRRRLW